MLLAAMTTSNRRLLAPARRALTGVWRTARSPLAPLSSSARRSYSSRLPRHGRSRDSSPQLVQIAAASCSLQPKSSASSMPAGLTKVLKPLSSRSADAERIGAVEFFGAHICRWAVEVQTTAWPTAFIHYTTMPRCATRRGRCVTTRAQPGGRARSCACSCSRLDCVAHRRLARTRLRGLRLRIMRPDMSATSALGRWYGLAPLCSRAPWTGED